MKILLRESQMIRVVKRELGEEITGGSIVVYHRTKLTKENYKLLNNGFVPGDGQMYGRGLYSTYELKEVLRAASAAIPVSSARPTSENAAGPTQPASVSPTVAPPANRYTPLAATIAAK